MHNTDANSKSHSSSELFWSLLEQLMREKPFNKKRLESILNITLRRFEANRFFEFYESDSFIWRDVRIGRIELRAKRGTDNLGLILIDINSPCIRLPEIESRYTDLSVVAPGGHSSDEMTYYSHTYVQGTLSFGFPQKP